MTVFLSWYLLVTFLGWLAFPLAFRLFSRLRDRGYALSRAAGLLVWGYVFWIFGSLGIAQNDLGGILLALAVLGGLSIWAFLAVDRGPESEGTDHSSPPIGMWLQSNLRLIITTEILFLAAFALLAFIRSANPELTSAEKPMELAFINAILRSPAFPPRDPWLSGYAISYYYFGYVITAMLAKLAGVPGSLAHNLMTALIFGLGAIGSYSILYNLLAAREGADGEEKMIRHITYHALIAPLFLLIVSNLEGLLEVLYRRGLFWSSAQSSNPLANSEGSFNFWTWLDMKELTSPPSPLPGSLYDRFIYWWGIEGFRGIDKWFSEQFVPNRHYLWWWRASRVVQDYDLAGNFREVIDEFPFFSFLHADLHPHVLAIPFGLLAIAAALNLFLGGWRGAINIFGSRLHLTPAGFFFSALVLGGLAFLNTWDILIAATLIVFAYVLARAHEGGWNWERLEDFFVLGLPLGLTAIILYLPFYLGFSSQAGGLLPNLISPTRGAHLWVMFGPLFIPLLTHLIYLWRSAKVSANWKLGLSLGISMTLFLWITSWLLGLVTQLLDPTLVQGFLASQGTSEARVFFVQATVRRLSYIGSLITLLAVLIPAAAFLTATVDCGPKTEDVQKPAVFVLLLIFLGSLLVLAPEFVYLRDQFGTRLNTVFKFYYQAWILWSLAAAFGTVILLQNLRGAWDWIFRLGLGLLLFGALIYPVLSLLTKTNNFNPPFGYTLDDFKRVQRENPDEAAAIQWLQTAPDGVVAEVVGDSYSGFARVSTHSGLSTVLGWPGHESQWRGGYAEQGSRREDIATLYTTPNWSIAEGIIHKYHIRYVFVGSLERSALRVQEEKFRMHLRPVFLQGMVVIYEAP